jgi:hypothetical protein
MRRQPLVLQAFLAVVALCLTANVRVAGTPSSSAAAFGSVHGETVAIAAPHATIGSVVAPRKSSPSDGSSRLFLPSRSIAAHDRGAAAPSAFVFSGLRDRDSLTFTYDATAPPAAILNTVR